MLSALNNVARISARSLKSSSTTSVFARSYTVRPTVEKRPEPTIKDGRVSLKMTPRFDEMLNNIAGQIVNAETPFFSYRDIYRGMVEGAKLESQKFSQKASALKLSADALKKIAEASDAQFQPFFKSKSEAQNAVVEKFGEDPSPIEFTAQAKALIARAKQILAEKSKTFTPEQVAKEHESRVNERSLNADLLLLSADEVANYTTPEGSLASYFTINYMNYPGVTKSDEVSALAQALKELPKLTNELKQKYDQELKAQFIKEMGLDKDISPQMFKDLGIAPGQLPSWQQINSHFDQIDKEEKEAIAKIEQEAAKNLA